MPLKILPASGSGSATLISVAGTTTNDTLTLPAKTGNIITSADSGTVTSGMLSTGGPTWTSGGDNTILGTLAMTGGGSFLRNRIINGDMRIDQRNAGAAVTTTGSSFYSVDRWTCFRNNSGWSVQQVSDAPSGFINSLKFTTTTASAGAVALVQQWFEGNNVSDFDFGLSSAKTITASFWVKSSVTGIFAVNFANGATNRCYVATYTISNANTWEYKTITLAGDTTGTWATGNTAGLRILFNIGTGGSSTTAGSWQSGDLIRTSSSVGIEGTLNATWQFTGVQLEVGSVATPFERRQYGQELALCQRYYEKSYGQSIAPGTSVTAGYGNVFLGTPSAINPGLSYTFMVEKRATPTLTTYDNAGNANKVTVYSGGWVNNTAVAANVSSTHAGYIQSSSSSTTALNFDYTALAEL